MQNRLVETRENDSFFPRSAQPGLAVPTSASVGVQDEQPGGRVDRGAGRAGHDGVRRGAAAELHGQRLPDDRRGRAEGPAEAAHAPSRYSDATLVLAWLGLPLAS